ncbi:hypothetical protein, partial [Desulfocurvus sp.]|uniref:hypothetical protein n=1 Tax=Desulfocurvus sp. TaxID=2871698 RepID=UPI0025C34520
MQYSLSGEGSQEPAAGTLSLKFAGKATEGKSINAELYARALLGFDRSFKRVNKVLLGRSTHLEVKAEQPGSFDAVLGFLLSPEGKAEIGFWLAAMAFFGVDAKSISKIPILIYKLIIDLIKKSKGRKERIREEARRLELDKGITSNLIKTIENSDLRRALDEMTSFLEYPRADSIEIRHFGNTKIVI